MQGLAQRQSICPPEITGLAEISQDYDGFIIDLWGVVHNGVELFDDVIPCLKQLKDLNKTIVFLTNAPRVYGAVVDHLTEMGMPTDLYDGVVTSGDLALDYLRRHPASSYYHIGIEEKDNSLRAGIGMNPAPTMAEAEIIIASNLFEHRLNLADYHADFEQAIAKSVPLVCANPDLRVIHGQSEKLCAGSLAAEYKKLGGDVTYFGKPYGATYDFLRQKYSANKWLAIGDALATDIKGANEAGIDCVMIKSGIHRDEALDDFSQREATPTFLSHTLSW